MSTSGQAATYTAVVARSRETGVLVAYVPGWPGAHAQGGSRAEVEQRLSEVIRMLLQDGPPVLEGEVIGTAELHIS